MAPPSTTSRAREFVEQFASTLADGTFLVLTFSNPRSRAEETPRRQTVRQVELKQGVRLQWSLDFDRRQTHENISFEASIERAATLLGQDYRNAHLFTVDADVAARVTKSGEVRITISAPTKQPTDANGTHDRQKQYLIPEGLPVPFLQELGVMTADGRVKSSKRDKFRQINRFLEFVEDIYQELPADGRLEVVDFGCGLSYLTFAMHHLLREIHAREVRILGVDQNPEVIERCRHTAETCGLQGIEFTRGTIAGIDSGPVHLAVSLHACDTASDDALAVAVGMSAQVILAAPCCQNELFTLLDSDALALLTRHGILKERFAALATDALRAAVLEQHGYRTQVMEFIETEHTPKNLLLRAVRRDAVTTDPQLSERVNAFKQLLGIDSSRLEDLLSRPDAAPMP